MSPLPHGGRRRLSGISGASMVLRILLFCALAAILLLGRDGLPGRDGLSSGGGGDGSGVEACDPDELTPEAREVVDMIDDGGSFEHPDKDGSTFGNREGLLPDEDHGYYAEYTVPTPGESDRGARRIVTGGDTTPRSGDTDPEHWYWTDDHYESFCEFAA